MKNIEKLNLKASVAPIALGLTLLASPAYAQAPAANNADDAIKPRISNDEWERRNLVLPLLFIGQGYRR